MVFYRKYRPQNISELDLESVRARLTSILSQEEIPHAFLFTGPKGLGKTSTARILAKAINCERRIQLTKNSQKSVVSSQLSGIEPCNECENCKSITNGSNLDVLEIDAASNRGIDEIRELRERIKFSPAALSKKVYIIDEVHMLTADAFNALLKTLEEPPTHAVFILCTTELEKVPPTITSRTFHIAFTKPTKEEAIASLKRIVNGEKLDVEENVYEKILSLSEGSFRDATKILQELSIAAGGKKITEEVLANTYKIGNIDKSTSELLTYLSKKNASKALSLIQTLTDSGVDFKVFTENLADKIRVAMLVRAGIEIKAQDLNDIATEDLVQLLSLVNQSYQDIKTSILPNLPLELVVAEWCLGENKGLNIKDKNEESLDVENEPIKAVEVKTEVIIEKPIKKENVAKDEKSEIKDEKNNVGMFSKNVLPETFFAALIDAVKRDNHSIAGILRGCKLVELLADKAIFEAKYKFHRDKLNEAKAIAILDKRASELLNRKVSVVIEMTAN